MDGSRRANCRMIRSGSRGPWALKDGGQGAPPFGISPASLPRQHLLAHAHPFREIERLPRRPQKGLDGGQGDPQGLGGRGQHVDDVVCAVAADQTLRRDRDLTALGAGCNAGADDCDRPFEVSGQILVKAIRFHEAPDQVIDRVRITCPHMWNDLGEQMVRHRPTVADGHPDDVEKLGRQRPARSAPHVRTADPRAQRFGLRCSTVKSLSRTAGRGGRRGAF